MKCQACGGDTSVKWTHIMSMGLKRRRVCKDCGKIATSHELWVEDERSVVDQD